MHLQKLEVESMEMRDVGDKVHKVGKLYASQQPHLALQPSNGDQRTLTQNTCSISKYFGRASLSFCMTCPKDEFMKSASSA